MFSICSRCRLRLAAQVPIRATPRFVSPYTTSIDHILDAPARDELASALEPGLKPRHANGGPRKNSPRRGHQQGKSARPHLQDRRTTHRRDEGRAPLRPASFTPSLSGIFDEASLATSKDLASLKDLLQRHKYREAWAKFLEIRTTTSSDATTEARSALARQAFKTILYSFKASWWQALSRGYNAPDMPSLREMQTSLAAQDPDSRQTFAVHAVHMASLSAKYSPRQQPLFESSAHQKLFEELMDYWAWFVKEGREHPDEEFTSPYSIFPKEPEQQLTSESQPADVAEFMIQLNPDYLDKNGVSPMVDLALCLLAVLRKAQARAQLPASFQEYAAFIEDMDRILKLSDFRRYEERFKSTLVRAGLNEATLAEVVGSLTMTEGDHKNNAASARPGRSRTGLIDSINGIVHSLVRYRERQNLDLVEQTWNNLKPQLENMSLAEKKDLAAHRLYEEFLLTFRVLRRADHTVQVWNHMVSHGFVPTVRTWNVMLKGCHIGKEVDAMETIWNRMLRAGIKPNAHSWGVRIHGLFQFGKINEGYRALTEMTEAADKWKPTNGEADEERPPRPDTITLNSALSGLARHGPEPVRNVLAWASGQGIKLDIITYNILINLAIHTGHKEDARRIMNQMAADGISPDSATFTILLHSMFRDGFLSDLEPAEQEAHAMDFIHSLGSDGLSLDVRGYALLLDRLLKECQNVKATRAVLAHMINSGIAPTAHMYTILITHYFDLDPPDIDAVESLWESIRSRPNYVVDVIFYDRMLEGFAKADKVTKMMYFLQRMGQEGKRPGWMALIEVLKCLRRKGDLNAARELVKDVEMTEGNLRFGVRGRKGYDDFWTLARQAM